MVRHRSVLLVALLAAQAGCAAGFHAPDPARTRAALIEQDRAFSRHAEARGASAAFAEFAAPEARLFHPGGEPIRGRQAIAAASDLGPGGSLRWSPQEADVGASGDLGYTWGRYELRMPDPRGESRVSAGKYVTIWKRQPDGAWKWVVDIGVPDPR